MALVSLVTICFENADELRKTLLSLRSLDPAVFETIVVDGSPSDSCARVIAEMPVTRYIHERDRGKYDAMNKGVLAASGKTVIAMNSGDTLNSAADFWRAIEQHADKLGSHVIYGDVIQSVGGRLIHVPAPPEIRAEDLRLGRFPSHQSVLIPRSFLAANPYDVAYSIAADTILMRKAFEQLPTAYIGVPIGVFSFGGVSTTPTSWKLVAQLYREATAARDMNLTERLRMLASIVGRKLFVLVWGHDALLQVQATRAARFKSRFHDRDEPPSRKV